MSEPKYPKVVVRTGGKMGWHPIAGIRRVQLALEAADVDAAEGIGFRKGSYQRRLQKAEGHDSTLGDGARIRPPNRAAARPKRDTVGST